MQVLKRLWFDAVCVFGALHFETGSGVGPTCWISTCKHMLHLFPEAIRTKICFLLS